MYCYINCGDYLRGQLPMKTYGFLIQMNLPTKQKRLRLREGTHSYLGGLGWTSTHDPLSGTGKSAQCCGAAWVEGSLGENGHMCVFG